MLMPETSNRAVRKACVDGFHQMQSDWRLLSKLYACDLLSQKNSIHLSSCCGFFEKMSAFNLILHAISISRVARRS